MAPITIKSGLWITILMIHAAQVGVSRQAFATLTRNYTGQPPESYHDLAGLLQLFTLVQTRIPLARLLHTTRLPGGEGIAR
jgi:hypothetical protein